MVLVTTGLLETLPDKNNEPILFLGEWCKLYKHKNVYEQYTYTTLPYHWDDRKKLHEDTIYIDKIYEKYLSILHQQLNNIHKVNFSVGYWRIIIGPWLRYFIEMVFDRYTTIQDASEYPIEYTKTLNIQDDDILPCDMEEFKKLHIDDLWNQFIYQNILKYFNINTRVINFPLKHPATKTTLKDMIKNKIKKIFFYLNSFNDAHFFSSYLSPINLLLLQIRLRQIPTLGNTINIDLAINQSNEIREYLTFPNETSLFEKILIDLIKKQIPKYYLEGYKKFRHEVLKTYPLKAKIIFTANAYSSDDAFKFWSAEKKEEGSKYIIGQHGGHYGMSLFSSHEKHQIISSDKFFSWGWDLQNNKVLPAGTMQLDKKIGYNKTGDVLIPLAALPRYSYHLLAMPIAGQLLNYVDDQFSYLHLSSPSLLKLLKFRTYQKDYGWDIKKRFIDAGFSNCLDSDSNLKKSFHTRLSECRLCIASYNATTYLETFSANFPTLLYWNPLHWELNESSKPYFDILQNAGILHYDEKTLILKLNEIYLDPMSWWMQKDIQTAKDQFCYRFVKKDTSFLLHFQQAIISIEKTQDE